MYMQKIFVQILNSNCVAKKFMYKFTDLNFDLKRVIRLHSFTSYVPYG